MQDRRKDRDRWRPRRRERPETKLARIFVIRNVVIALLLALMVVLIVFVSIPRMRTQAAAGALQPAGPDAASSLTGIPTGDGQLVGDLPAYIVSQDEHQTVIQVGQPDPKLVNPITTPELYYKYEFTYACGHAGEFVPARTSNSAMADPEKFKAGLEQTVCGKCRELIEYKEEKKELDQASSAGGQSSGGEQ